MKINITIPAYNEEKIIKNNITVLYNFLEEKVPEEDWFIVLADNNSSDKTGEIGKSLAQKFPKVKYSFTEKKGKGIAIKTAWQKHGADIYIFMDADLATDLEALPNLIDLLKKGDFDIVAGSRFHKNSLVDRSVMRKLISFGYRFFKKIIINSKVSDAPCGFKGISKKAAEEILPITKNNGWFFDSELIIIAERKYFAIKEIPIKWKDLREGADKSKVQVFFLIIEYIKNIFELKKRLKNIC